MSTNEYTVRLLAIFAENKVGKLASITGPLAESHINVRWVTIASSEKFGVLKMLVDRIDDGYEVLKRAGHPVTIVKVLTVEVEDKPGGLHAIARCLSDNKVNINNASGFVAKTRAILLIEVDDLSQAMDVLKKNGFKLLTEEETIKV